MRKGGWIDIEYWNLGSKRANMQNIRKKVKVLLNLDWTLDLSKWIPWKWCKLVRIELVWERKLNIWRRPPPKTIFGPFGMRCGAVGWLAGRWCLKVEQSLSENWPSGCGSLQPPPPSSVLPLSAQARSQGEQFIYQTLFRAALYLHLMRDFFADNCSLKYASSSSCHHHKGRPPPKKTNNFWHF